MRRTWHAARIVALICFVSLATGCGKRTGKVSGVITFEGKPVTSGSVMFAPPGEPPVTAEIEAGGKYTLAKVPYGLAQVAVVSPDPNPPGFDKLPPGVKHPSGKELPVGPRVEAKDWFPIPDDYASFTDSGLTFEVNQKEATFNIVLKDKKPPE